MADCRRRAGAVDVALPHAVYTGVQMLEIHPKSATLCHFSGPSARLAGGKARSATRCSIMRSDMSPARPGPSQGRVAWVHRKCHTEFR